MELDAFIKVTASNGDVRYVAYPAKQSAPLDDGEVAVSISKDEYNMHVLALTTRIKTDKEIRLEAVSDIVVTTATGKVFDGDEVSQGRMTRAIQMAAIAGETTTSWKLQDNSIVEVTLEELEEALLLAGRQMSAIWLGV